MSSRTDDLFDNSSMSFGDHLEALRVHLFRGLIGLVIAVVVCLFFGESIVRVIRRPIDQAVKRKNMAERVQDDIKGFDLWGFLKEQFVGKSLPAGASEDVPTKTFPNSVELQFSALEVANQLHALAPQDFPPANDSLKDKLLTLQANSPLFGDLRRSMDKIEQPVALHVMEAFMTYLKVSGAAGLVVSSPWIFYQIWQFVAAGMYPHERKYVYIYLPLSLLLFFGGCYFCFAFVFPTALDFLLGFNQRMGITLQPRISEWISFAVLFPLMFGISFQLPLIMVALNKLGIVAVDQFVQQWRIAVLIIAVASMVLTPTQDPGSMLMMMGPLLCLYWLGIGLCYWTGSNQSPLGRELPTRA